MNIVVTQDYVKVDNVRFDKAVDNSRLDQHRNQVINEVLEYMSDLEKELIDGLEDIEDLTSNKFLVENNIYLLRSLKETIGYMKIRIVE
jgi:hypothetical protein